MKDQVMFSFMEIDFEQFIHENQRQHFIENLRQLPFTRDAFLVLMVGIFSDYFADLTEQVARNIRSVYTGLQTKNTFSEPGLDEITKLKFNSFSIKESLTEFRRVLHLLRKSALLSAEIKDRIHSELNDLLVINEYVQNNIERLSDLKEYVSGKIDIEQNRVFKTLTIVTLCISAPMLIAGIYGMNFKYMPELDWKYGYVYVLVLIVMSFLLPLIWFKRKRWM
jgi:magnesium transporter